MRKFIPLYVLCRYSNPLYSVALKHYLRGEEGCHYTDLYPLIKFLPVSRERFMQFTAGRL
jgi:hypothetical protein